MKDVSCNETQQTQNKKLESCKPTTNFSEIIHPTLNQSQNEDYGTQDILTAIMDKDWNEGEGEFNWKGRSTRTGNPNSVTLNTSTHEMNCYLAEFTNLNNDYWANPMYKIELFEREGGHSLGFVCFDTVAVPDEDAGNHPTVQDVRNRGVRVVTPEAKWFAVVGKSVYWSYLNGNNGTCKDHM